MRLPALSVLSTALLAGEFGVQGVQLGARPGQLDGETPNVSSGGSVYEKVLKELSEEEALVELTKEVSAGSCLANVDVTDLDEIEKINFSELLQNHSLAEEVLGEAKSALKTLRVCLFKKAHKAFKKLSERKESKANFQLNPFAFMTKAEFKKHFAGFKPVKPDTPNANETALFVEEEARNLQGSSTPDIDWVGTAVSTQVQNQQSCGGCWAFAASECIAAVNWIQNQQAINEDTFQLSAQQLISCDNTGFNQGCNGGNPQMVWGGAGAYTKSNALVTAGAYPFVDAGGTTSSCDTSLTDNGVATASGNMLLSGTSFFDQYPSNEQVYSTLEKNPATIAVYAAAKCFQYYQSGVLTLEDCLSTGDMETSGSCELDHAILLVGVVNYGTSDMAFKIKNSWGDTWGEGGYIYFGNNYTLSDYSCNGLLGMNEQISYPITTNLVGTPSPSVDPGASNFIASTPTPSGAASQAVPLALTFAALCAALIR